MSGWKMYAVRILVSLPQKSSAFREVLCQRAPDPVTLRLMHSGPTFRLRPSTLARHAFASVAPARADESRVRVSANRRAILPNVGAKAKKQPLI
jgi:hypothetical protein